MPQTTQQITDTKTLEKTWEEMLSQASYYQMLGRMPLPNDPYYDFVKSMKRVYANPQLEIGFNYLIRQPGFMRDFALERFDKVIPEHQPAYNPQGGGIDSLHYKFPTDQVLLRAFYLSDESPDFEGLENNMRTELQAITTCLKELNSKDNRDKYLAGENSVLGIMSFNDILLLLDNDSKIENKDIADFNSHLNMRGEILAHLNSINEHLRENIKQDIQSKFKGDRAKAMSNFYSIFNTEEKGKPLDEPAQNLIRSNKQLYEKYKFYHRLNEGLKKCNAYHNTMGLERNGAGYPERKTGLLTEATMKERSSTLSSWSGLLGNFIKKGNYSDEWKAMIQALNQASDISYQLYNDKTGQSKNMSIEENRQLQSAMKLLKETAHNFLEHKLKQKIDIREEQNVRRLNFAKRLEAFANYDLKQVERNLDNLNIQKGSQIIGKQKETISQFLLDFDKIHTIGSSREYNRLHDSLINLLTPNEQGKSYQEAVNDVLKCAKAYMNHKKTHNNGSKGSLQRMDKVLQLQDYLEPIQAELALTNGISDNVSQADTPKSVQAKVEKYQSALKRVCDIKGDINLDNLSANDDVPSLTVISHILGARNAGYLLITASQYLEALQSKNPKYDNLVAKVQKEGLEAAAKEKQDIKSYNTLLQKPDWKLVAQLAGSKTPQSLLDAVMPKAERQNSVNNRELHQQENVRNNAHQLGMG